MYVQKQVFLVTRLTIAISLSCLSGLAIGSDVVDNMEWPQVMNTPATAVDRDWLGRNAFRTAEVRVQSSRVTHQNAAINQNDEIGRTINGVRQLVPHEPGRKVERLRLEEQEKWYAETFVTETSDFGQHDGWAETQASWEEASYR